MTSTDFKSICRRNAERFLKTAFLLDDEVVFEETATLTSSSTLQPKEDSPSSSAGTDEEPTERQKTPLKGHILSKSFLQKGISCSILKLSKDEIGSKSLESCIIEIIQNVDLPILDWNLWDDDGEWIIVILKRLIEESDYPAGRVALILIYTAEEVEHVYLKLRESVEGWDSESEETDLLSMGGLRVRIAKRDDVLSEESLPEYLIKEFSNIHQGILENAVIQAISEIREKTFHILHRFPPELDAPFLAHQAALPHPDDSGVHAVELITSEIVSLLMQAGLSDDIVSEEAIEAMLANADNGLLSKTHDNQVRIITREKIREIIASGAFEKNVQLILGQNETLGFKSNRGNAITKLVNILSGANDIEDPMGIENNAKLAQLFSFQGHYSEFTPILSLGTIVQSANSYLVCILPYCDSERIEDERDFPFLKLKSRAPGKGGGGICFVIGHDVKLFVPILSPYELEIHRFPADSQSKRVLATQKDNKWKFSDINGDKYIWYGTLKRECAQRIANDFGAQISRVGFNESEWQRR